MDQNGKHVYIQKKKKIKIPLTLLLLFFKYNE